MQTTVKDVAVSCVFLRLFCMCPEAAMTLQTLFCGRMGWCHAPGAAAFNSMEYLEYPNTSIWIWSMEYPQFTCGVASSTRYSLLSTNTFGKVLVSFYFFFYFLC